MKKITLLVIMGLAFFACKTKTEENQIVADDESVVEIETSVMENLCFSKNDNGFVQEMKIEIEEDNVTGEFNTIPVEKDASMGTISGTKTDNTITAVYEYMIEGQVQREEISIVLNDAAAVITRPGKVEVNGEVIERDGGMETVLDLPKVSCQE